MTDNILAFTGETLIPIEPNELLEKAKAWNLTNVVICGWGEDGEFIFGGSHCEIGPMLLLLEIAKARLIRRAESR